MRSVCCRHGGWRILRGAAAAAAAAVAHGADLVHGCGGIDLHVVELVHLEDEVVHHASDQVTSRLLGPRRP